MTLLVLGLLVLKKPTDRYTFLWGLCMQTHKSTQLQLQIQMQIQMQQILSKTQPTDTHFFSVYVCGPTFAFEPITNTNTIKYTNATQQCQPTNTHFFSVYVCGPTFAFNYNFKYNRQIHISSGSMYADQRLPVSQIQIQSKIQFKHSKNQPPDTHFFGVYTVCMRTNVCL